MVNEFHKSPLQFYFTTPFEDSILPTLRVEGDAVLKEFGFHYQRFGYDIVVILSFCLYYVLFTYYCLTRVPQSIREVNNGGFSFRALFQPLGTAL